MHCFEIHNKQTVFSYYISSQQSYAKRQEPAGEFSIAAPLAPPFVPRPPYGGPEKKNLS
jgi:hypothetical protein